MPEVVSPSRNAECAYGEHKKIHRYDVDDGVAHHLGMIRHQSTYDGQTEEAHVSEHGCDGQNAIPAVRKTAAENKVYHPHKCCLQHQRNEEKQSHLAHVRQGKIQLQEGGYDQTGSASVN